MSSTFLRLELYGERAGTSPSVTLVNVDHIRRIYPAWPSGCTIIMEDDVPGLHVKHSFADITLRLVATGGRVVVKTMPEPNGGMP